MSVGSDHQNLIGPPAVMITSATRGRCLWRNVDVSHNKLLYQAVRVVVFLMSSLLAAVSYC